MTLRWWTHAVTHWSTPTGFTTLTVTLMQTAGLGGNDVSVQVHQQQQAGRSGGDTDSRLGCWQVWGWGAQETCVLSMQWCRESKGDRYNEVYEERKKGKKPSDLLIGLPSPLSMSFLSAVQVFSDFLTGGHVCWAHLSACPCLLWFGWVL